MVGAWKRFLLDRIVEWHLPTGGEWNFVIRNNYQPHGGSINVMWFHNGGEFPRVVVKFYNDPAPLRIEFENMRRVHGCAPAVVPNPLHFGAQGSLWGFWMEGVPGSPFATFESYAPDLLRSLTETVASLHAAVRQVPANCDPDRYGRMGQEPLEAVAQFGSSAAVKAGCSRIAAAISEHWVNSLPVIPQHGDLYSGNLLLHRSRFSIVDWESFGAVDLPFYDLLILFYSLLRDSGKTPASWHPTLVSQIPALIGLYANRLGLNPADVPLLLPLALSNWFSFHLREGHKAFAENMYGTIQQYFESPEPWKRAFLPLMTS
jgi:aminoglycoside phosphotransferase (APT) family kinase protein